MARVRHLMVVLNGTDTNPYHALGLRQNPFPQIATAEHTPHCLHVQALGGDPIPDVEYLRNYLKGYNQDFIDLCCSKFEKGKLVKFIVRWTDA